MIPSGTEIFLALEPIDLRCGFNRLSGIAREALGYCSRAGLKVAPRADPFTRRDGFAEDAGSMVVVEIWAEISDFG